MTGFEIGRDLVLLALGVIGTGLSIYNLLESRGRGIRRVRVFAETAMHTYDNGEIGPPFLKVVAANSGHRDVTISNIGLEIPGKRVIATLNPDAFSGVPDTRTPTKLADGDLAHRFYEYTAISQACRDAGLQGKVSIHPFVVDTAGMRHYGKKLKWDASANWAS
ncbi:hypothetical protein ACRARG_00280 [Pseudooceanicola sp. C21-150M6]|uniref:hypothetical protein n=1 Tax=Pseudooceanicola sp. C21-150M6 TaxID=3434355 RepID=UPI003D7FF64B